MLTFDCLKSAPCWAANFSAKTLLTEGSFDWKQNVHKNIKPLVRNIKQLHNVKSYYCFYRN